MKERKAGELTLQDIASVAGKSINTVRKYHSDKRDNMVKYVIDDIELAVRILTKEPSVPLACQQFLKLSKRATK